MLLFFPFGFRFILSQANWFNNISSRILAVFLFIPPLALFILIESNLVEYEIVESSSTYWISNPIQSAATNVFLLTVAFGAVLLLALHWLYYFRRRNCGKGKRQALVLALGLTLPVTFGVLYEIIFPLFFKVNDVPVSGPLVTIYSLMSVIAVKKYKMLDFSPKHHWEEIVESMNEGIIIVDNEDRIQYANNAFCRLSGYGFDELEGKISHQLLVDKDQQEILVSTINERKNKRNGQYEINSRTKDGRLITVLVSGAPYMDAKGKVIGSIGVITDISSLKETERKLAYSEARLQQAQSVAHVGSWEQNFATQKSVWSDEACRIFGISTDERYNQSCEKWTSAIHPDDLARVEKEIEKSQASFSDTSVKHRIVRKDGVIRHLHSVSKYEFDNYGKPIGLFGVCCDITEQVEAAEAVAYSEARLKQAQMVAKVGNWELDLATERARWSDEACRIYGVPVEEKDNQSFSTWASLVHPDDHAMSMQLMRESRENLSDLSFNHRIKWRDGTVRHIHSFCQFEFDAHGKPVGLFGVCRDITEKVEAERALKESEDNMRTFINESTLSIYFLDPKTKRIIYSNPSLCGLLGYTKDELKKISPYDFINHPKEDVDLRMSEVMQQKRISNGEREWKRKDGKIVHVLVNSFYHTRNGNDAIYVAAQDISEIKHTEEKLKITNKELETFIYKASHDIRGPLASIMGLVNVSRLEVNDPTAVKYLNMIDNATQKLDCTLGELVKAMRIKDVNLSTEKVDLDELIKEVLNKFTHFPGFEKLKIHREIEVRDAFYSNASILETILQNLVENAIKYQKTYSEEPYLKIRVVQLKNDMMFAISDNGTGIDESLQSQVFDMYFRATSESKGSGLGLYLVKKAVEKLGGEIRLRSQRNVGTTFFVLIPSVYIQGGETNEKAATLN